MSGGLPRTGVGDSNTGGSVPKRPMGAPASKPKGPPDAEPPFGGPRGTIAPNGETTRPGGWMGLKPPPPPPRAAADSALLPPDVADMALRDAASGKVRRIRAGSMRDSIVGQAMEFAWLIGVVGVSWLRAVLRGDVW